MITAKPKDYQVLLDRPRGVGMVVSCYADTSVTEGFEIHWRPRLKAEPTRIRGLLTGDLKALREFERQLEAIRPALESPQARPAQGMAVFATSGWDQAMALPSDEPYEDRLVVDEEPYLVPLFMADYRRREYLMVLTDTHCGRLFVSSPGTSHLLDALDEDVPKGKHQASDERHRKAHLLRYQMEPPKLHPTDVLILVDVQNDFCPGGALPVEGGGRVVPVLNRWMRAAEEGGAKVIASRDWHPPGHVSFQVRGGLWPAHCVQNTAGAELHPGLDLPVHARVISKGTDPDRDNYSAFDGTGLADELNQQGVRRVWVGGLAQDVCVRATVLDGLQAGFEMHLIKDATRAVNAHSGDGERALQEMREAGCVIEDGGG